MPACKKQTAGNNFEMLQSCGGNWNIDEIRLSVMIAPDSLVKDTMMYNQGNFQFYGDDATSMYHLKATIDLTDTTIGPYSNCDMTVLDSSIYFSFGDTSSYMNAEIVKISSKKIVLYSHHDENTITDGAYEHGIYFRCSKK
jgi:hypothetical protein